MAEVNLEFFSTQVARVLEGQRNADQLLRLIIGSIEGMERRLGSVEGRVASVELRLANMSDELRSAIKLEVGKAILQFGDRFDDFHDRLRALEESAGPTS